MSHRKRNEAPASPEDELIRESAAAELHLLMQERKAEAQLGKARSAMDKHQARLHRAQERFERGSRGVKAAEASLRDAQAKRATGPGVAD